jgi:hypothetical protein
MAKVNVNFVWVNISEMYRIRLNMHKLKKNRLWQSCLLTDQDEISNLYRGPSIDTSYQVSVHLAKRFQRRRFLEIDQSETRTAMFANRSGPNKQSL